MGAPWIELSDAKGRLVRRLHVELGRPLFASGLAPIRELIHRGTGALLTQYLSSPECGKPHLLAAINCVVRAGLETSTLEEKFTYLSRASRLFVTPMASRHRTCSNSSHRL